MGAGGRGGTGGEGGIGCELSRSSYFGHLVMLALATQQLLSESMLNGFAKI